MHILSQWRFVMKRNLYFIILCLLLNACQDNPNLFRGAIKYANWEKKEYKLHGNIFLKIDSIGTFQIDFFSKYVLVTQYKSPYFLTLYRKSNYEKKGNYFIRGNGPDEFLGFSILNQKQDSLLLLQDYYRKQIVVVDFIDSGEKFEDKIRRKIDYSNIVEPLQAFYYNDSLLLIKSLDASEGILYNYYDYHHKKVTEKFSMYNAVLGQQDLNNMMSLADAIKPDKTKLVSLTGIYNQIDIFDLKNPSNSFSVYSNRRNVTLEQTRNYPDELYDYYISLPRCNNKCIYVLSQDKQNEKKEFHVIDWNGNALYKLHIDEPLRDFNIDWYEGVLYGITDDDIVYVYNIKRFIM